MPVMVQTRSSAVALGIPLSSCQRPFQTDPPPLSLRRSCFPRSVLPILVAKTRGKGEGKIFPGERERFHASGKGIYWKGMKDSGLIFQSRERERERGGGWREKVFGKKSVELFRRAIVGLRCIGNDLVRWSGWEMGREENDKKWKRWRKIVTLHPSWIRGNAFQCKHHSLFCTSNIQDQISFVRASIMRKSYHSSVKLGVRTGGLSIDSFLFRKEKKKEYF